MIRFGNIGWALGYGMVFVFTMTPFDLPSGYVAIGSLLFYILGFIVHQLDDIYERLK